MSTQAIVGGGLPDDAAVADLARTVFFTIASCHNYVAAGSPESGRSITGELPEHCTDLKINKK